MSGCAQFYAAKCAADSLSVWTFLRLASPASPPDHSTISRTVFGRSSSGGLRVGAGAVGGGEARFGEDAGHRRDAAGSERGDAEHRATGHGRGINTSACYEETT